MLGCSYELNVDKIDMSAVTEWLTDFMPSERWKLTSHPYDEFCMLLWFRFESDALMFGLAHDRAPRTGARVYLSIMSRISTIAAAALMLLWMFLWVKLGYIILRPWARLSVRLGNWVLLTEPDFDEFMERRSDICEALAVGFARWHRDATGAEPS